MLAPAFAPALYRRLEPGTAGTIGFLLRLVTILAMTIVALRIAGLQASERVRVQAGILAGRLEGVVGQLGLFHTTLVSGADASSSRTGC
jgi:small conductance mechanosensitive channel